MLNERVLRQMSAELKEPNWVLDNRLDAFEKFSGLEIPNFKYGIGISLNISDMDFSQINPEKIITERNVKAHKPVEVLSFSEALEKYPEILKECLMSKYSPSEENKFSALHAAFFNNGIFIRIPENTQINELIQIAQNNSESKSIIEYIFVIAEKNSSAAILENIKSSDNKKSFRSQVIEVFVHENANVEYVSTQNLGSLVYNFVRRNSRVERNGFMHWVDCSIGSKFTQHLTSTDLIGVGAESGNTGIIFGDNDQFFDIKGIVCHSGSNTTSDMNSRIVLNHHAKTIYRGLVQIKPGAINCKGYQKEDTILLNENSHADVVPNLEISNNEVKCSHGATISQIDEDKLFYMMSRGLSERSSRKTIVEGFFDPVLAKIKDSEIKEDILNAIRNRLEEIE